METDNYVEKFWANFTLSLFPGFDFCRSLPFGICKPYDISLMNKISECYSNDNPINLLKLQNLLLEIIIEIIEQYDTLLIDELSLILKYEKLFTWLDQNLKADLTVEEMADIVAVSPSTLQKGFRERCGVSPKSFVRKRLLEKARSLLCFSALNVGQIAEELGFEDPSYFSRFFKKSSGFSPLKYRRKFGPSSVSRIR